MPDKDRVQVPSRRKDGTVDQTDDYEIIGDPETAKAAIGAQLAQMKVAEADAARANAAAAADQPQLSPDEQATRDQHDALIAEGQAEADAEVDAHLAQTDEPTTTTTRRRKSTETTAER